MSIDPVPSSVLDFKILLRWSTSPASPTDPSGAFSKLLALTLTWSLCCTSAASGRLLCSLCTAQLVFRASQNYHNLSPTRLIPCSSHTRATLSSEAVLSWPPAHAACHPQLLQLLIPDRYSFLPAFFLAVRCLFLLPLCSGAAWFCLSGIHHARLELLPVDVQWVTGSAGFVLFLRGGVTFY